MQHLSKALGFLKWGLISQFFFAFSILVGFIFFSGPMMIGAGKFDSVIHIIETIDYRWWIAAIIALYFLLSLFLLTLFAILNSSFDQVDTVKEIIYKLIKDRKIPIRADINERIKVELDKEVEAKFKVSTSINIDQKVHVKANIPIKLNFPLDTVIETKVLGIGKVKIPIKTLIPLDMNFPFDGEVSMKVNDFKIDLEEKAIVEIPPLEVPVNCQVEVKLNLESNLQNITDRL